jgi:hypothetical protein
MMICFWRRSGVVCSNLRIRGLSKHTVAANRARSVQAQPSLDAVEMEAMVAERQ